RLRGNVVHCRAEHAWQAEEGCLHVEFRQRFAAGNDLVDCGMAMQQSDHRLLAFDDDAATRGASGLCIANELKRVTQPLLGPQQDRATVQGLAVPGRLGELARMGTLFLPAPGALSPTLVESTQA